MTDPTPRQEVITATQIQPIFGQEWLRNQNLKHDFVGPVVPGQTATVARDLNSQSSGPIVDPFLLVDPTLSLWNPPIPGSLSYSKEITATACRPLSTTKEHDYLPHASAHI
jgi:hypothetical protein